MTSSQSKVVIGYASIWTPIEFSKIPGNSLTHIVYSFLNIKSDGTLIFGDDGCDKCCATNFLNQLLQVKYKYKHLKIHISVGGASWASSFLPVLSDGSKREILVNAINDLLTTYHLDGIDIDWEYPGTNQGSYFVQFAKELRQKLHSSIEITCAIPSSPTTLRNYNIADSNPYFNWFNIMAYDASIGSGYITHQAPLFRNPSNPTEDASGDTAVKALLNYGVPSNKIVLGVPLYGYLYKATTNDNSNHGLFQSISCTQNCETTVNNKDISSSSPNTRYFDPIAQAPWLYNVNTGAFISFEDLDSVQYKINYVNNQALKGVMFWELGQDNLGSTSVINSVFKNLNNISLEDMTYTYTPLPMPGISD